MTMGEMIRKCRKELDLTQTELGQKLNPPVNRSAICKWEHDIVFNLKRSHIEQMAIIFGKKPSELMSFDERFDVESISAEVKTLEMVQKVFGQDAVTLLQFFQGLNEVGQAKALEDLGDLSLLTKYTEKREDQGLLNA